MASATRIIHNSINFIHRYNLSTCILSGLSQVRHYAARKSTREKARKKKSLTIMKKLTLADKIQKSKKNKVVQVIKPDALRYFDESKPAPTDDVYLGRIFKWNIYPFSEAILNHREFFHPTMYDYKDPYVQLLIEFNMKGVKKTKPVEPFKKLLNIKHKFDHGEERRILAICPPEEEAALEAAGALHAGGTNIVKDIMSGSISLDNFDIVIANVKLMPEILTIRGLLKKKIPTLKAETLGGNTLKLLNHQLNSVTCSVKTYKDFPEYGYSTVSIGTLDMDINHLEENMKIIIDNLMLSKPKRSGSFITRIRVICPPSNEKFKINHNLYIKEEKINTEIEDEVALPLE
ncbi:PREDICTED: uncharacterized protein LOC105365310 [Ceratosolen solmsi marchali]|uniref:Uncharacterized protein LOC105365310 n=1 Tax=Ceratosolen solmsi marchali TaxID=326594 RepID=A0AAJ7DZ53_9HYME|nr:PREDICTED: uncharacterized protein LOC105365310 [Ceratosolen solmsi marchali]